MVSHWVRALTHFVLFDLFCRYCCSFSTNILVRMSLISSRLVPNVVGLVVFSSMARAVLSLWSSSGCFRGWRLNRERCHCWTDLWAWFQVLWLCQYCWCRQSLLFRLCSLLWVWRGQLQSCWLVGRIATWPSWWVESPAYWDRWGTIVDSISWVTVWIVTSVGYKSQRWYYMWASRSVDYALKSPYWSPPTLWPSFPVRTGVDETECFCKFRVFVHQVSNYSEFYSLLLFHPFIILPLFPQLSCSSSLLTVPPVSHPKPQCVTSDEMRPSK